MFPVPIKPLNRIEIELREHGLQQSLDLLGQYSQTWAPGSKPQKDTSNDFQRSQGIRAKFSIGTKYTEYCIHYNYFCFKIISTGHLNQAMNELGGNAHRAFYAIKKLILIEIPIKMCLKRFECVIASILLFGSEVWGPLAKQDFTQGDKHPFQTLHAGFCKIILHVQK
jgi:hypothetical protein